MYIIYIYTHIQCIFIMRVAGNFVCSYLLMREGLCGQPSICISKFSFVFPQVLCPLRAFLQSVASSQEGLEVVVR